MHEAAETLYYYFHRGPDPWKGYTVETAVSGGKSENSEGSLGCPLWSSV